MPTLDWIAKEKVVNHHMEVPYRVLEPQYTYGEDTGNMIIHGDNLEALKSLLPEYEGKIKCIYIDPPYNTAKSTDKNKAWVYSDNVDDPVIKEWLGKVVGPENEDLSRHDKWLCMMYPRLKLLEKLLAENGAIFISIDNNEKFNLKPICDEIFGKQNFISDVAVINNLKGRSDDKYIATAHESLLIYHKGSFITNGVSIPDEYDTEYNLTDENGRYRLQGLRKRGDSSRREDRPNMFYPFFFDEKTNELSLDYKKGSIEILPHLSDGSDGRWRWKSDTARNRISELTVQLVSGRNEYDVFQKDYITDEKRIKPKSFWSGTEFSAETGTLQVKGILGKDVFSKPKPTGIVEYIIEQATSNDSIILDSFAGSGTTAHAVLNANRKDGGNRKFILVEMMHYADTITAERVKRVIQKAPSQRIIDRKIYDLEISMEVLKSMPQALEEAKIAKKNAVASGKYKKVSNPKVDKGHLIVTATIEFDEYKTSEGFTYYELGEKLMNGEYINEKVPLDKIRRYVYFTETKQAATDKNDEPFYLGTYIETAYYFYYDKDTATTLDNAFLSTIKTKAESYVIYADRCILSEEELSKYHITFKKIPRDITRL